MAGDIARRRGGAAMLRWRGRATKCFAIAGFTFMMMTFKSAGGHFGLKVLAAGNLLPRFLIHTPTLNALRRTGGDAI